MLLLWAVVTYLIKKMLTWALQSLKNFVSHETEEGYKIWKGIGLSFQNWHEEFYLF